MDKQATSDTQFNLFSRVWVYSPIPNNVRKLQILYRGPYYITRKVGHNAYKIAKTLESPELTSTISAHRLRPFYDKSTIPAAPTQQELVEIEHKDLSPIDEDNTTDQQQDNQVEDEQQFEFSLFNPGLEREEIVTELESRTNIHIPDTGHSKIQQHMIEGADNTHVKVKATNTTAIPTQRELSRETPAKPDMSDSSSSADELERENTSLIRQQPKRKAKKTINYNENRSQLAWNDNDELENSEISQILFQSLEKPRKYLIQATNGELLLLSREHLDSDTISDMHDKNIPQISKTSLQAKYEEQLQ